MTKAFQFVNFTLNTSSFIFTADQSCVKCIGFAGGKTP